MLPYDPVILLPGIFPRGREIYVHIKTGTQIFKTALFTIDKIKNNS